MTKKQKELYDYIRNNLRLLPPSRRSIAKALKKEQSSITTMIHRMKKQGFLDANAMPVYKDYVKIDCNCTNYVMKPEDYKKFTI